MEMTSAWDIVCMVIVAVFCSPAVVRGEDRNGGSYDPCAHVYSNHHHDKKDYHGQHPSEPYHGHEHYVNCLHHVHQQSQNGVSISDSLVHELTAVLGSIVPALLNLGHTAQPSTNTPPPMWTPVKTSPAPLTTPAPTTFAVHPVPKVNCVDQLSTCVSYGPQICIGALRDWAKVQCEKFCAYCIPLQTTPPTTVSGPAVHQLIFG